MEARITYTEKLARQGVLYFMKRTVGVTNAVMVLLATIWCAVQLRNGDSSLATLLFSATVVVFVVFIVLGYWLHLAQAMKKFRAMSPKEATFRAEQDQFTFISSLGTTTMPWKSIEQIWQFDDLWLLLFSKSQFSALPLECLSAEMRSYLVDRVKAAGGKVS